MKNIKYIATFLIFLIIGVSCSDKAEGIMDEETSIATFEDYFKFLNQETNSGVLIQSMSTINSNGETFSIASDTKGDKAPLTLKVNDRTLSFNNYSYSSKQNRSYSNISNQDLRSVFGNKFEIELTNSNVFAKTSEAITESLSSVYIPEVVSSSFSNLSQGKVVVGTIINWNTDSLNENGVVIGLEYNPLAQYDELIVKEKSDRLLTGLTVEDNGSYTVTAEDLAQYPSNAMMTLYVGRAGYNITTNSTGEVDYSMAAMTVMRADLEIQK
jgi:hypothetical protein